MNPEDLIQVGSAYYPKGMRPATNEETIAKLEAEILRLRTTEDARFAQLEADLKAAREEVEAYREALETIVAKDKLSMYEHMDENLRACGDIAAATLAQHATPADAGKEQA